MKLTYQVLTLASLLNIISKPIIAQTASYAMWFQPGVLITRLQSTMIVPKTSTGSGLHAVWPGLEDQGNAFVYQSVLGDSQGAGRWKFWVEYCCNPDVKHEAFDVSPGDEITSVMSYSNGQWTSSFWISGSDSISGSYTDTAVSTHGDLNKVLLAIELRNGASWDIGQVQWTNLQITASTTSTTWCGQSFSITGSFSYQVSGSSSSVAGTSVTCTWSSIVFQGPK